ncbi:MAG TPA: esterase [Actinomycetota bacterium]|nr:esterase [Actinomycetota bacterium]
MTETTSRVVEFEAGDGMRLNLVNVRGPREPVRGPVMLVHGAGVRANIFRAPVERTVVDALVDDGYDVWLENWRASIDVPPNEWTLDQAAVHDHPAAVRKVLDETGAGEMKAVVHCQGSTSFVMSAVAGLVPEVKTVVTNAVSLHTMIPAFSRAKIRYAAPLIARATPYLDPQWGVAAPTTLAKAMVAFVKLFHHECRNPVCKMVSFTYGTGFPCLWQHENLNPETHDRWLNHEFAKVPLTFFAQMARCVDRGHLVSVEGYRELPEDFVAQEPQTDARFVMLAGKKNRCFLPESQELTFRFLDRHRPGYHSMHEIPGYGHLDVFMGKDAARDTFPLILEGLRL